MSYSKFSFLAKPTKKYFKPKKVLPRKERFQPISGWTQQHIDIFHFIENEDGNMAVEACAGSGKTTTLVEVNYRLLEQNSKLRILDLAFNTDIAVEFVSKLPKEVDCFTVHAFGKKIVDREWGKGKKLNVDGNNLIAYNLASSLIGPEDEKEEERLMLIKACNLAKDRLLAFSWFSARNGCKEIPISVLEEIATVINSKYNIETNYPIERFAEFICKMMMLTQDQPLLAGGIISISFSDMVWLPCVNNWNVPQYDIVLIDEAQDISKARSHLASRAKNENGRIILCFDRYQAIYGFAGADVDTALQLTEQFKARVFPLSVSYRCAQAIVEKAKEFNPTIEASSLASEGLVDAIPNKQLEKQLKIGDAILSRKNAPLVKLFFSLAKRNIPVSMLGKDFWMMLQMRACGWEPLSLNHLSDCNELFLSTRERFLREKNASTVRLHDECATIDALIKESFSLGDFFKNLKQIRNSAIEYFNTRCITLASVHKSKGLEWNHVYLLIETFSKSSQEELNLNYVAITRAKGHLTYVEKN